MRPNPSGDRELRNPITGIAGCCARAASGIAAAPPTAAMKSRRPPMPGAFCAAWNSTTPRSTPVGSTWSKSRSVSCAASV